MQLALFGPIGGIELVILAAAVVFVLAVFWLIFHRRAGESDTSHAVRGLTGVLVIALVIGGVVAFAGWAPIRSCPDCNGVGGALGLKCPTCGGAGKLTLWQLFTAPRHS